MENNEEIGIIPKKVEVPGIGTIPDALMGASIVGFSDYFRKLGEGAKTGIVVVSFLAVFVIALLGSRHVAQKYYPEV